MTIIKVSFVIGNKVFDEYHLSTHRRCPCENTFTGLLQAIYPL